MRINGSFRNWSLIAVALLVVFGVTACGGGGSAGGGIGGTGKAVGAITAFGSIFVNGVEFETGSATVRIDDTVHPDDSGLRLGMIVKVEGEFNDDGTTGTATTVSSNDVVEGPVTSAVNTTTKSFGVMGQVVFYTVRTVFEISGGSTLAPTDLDLGNVVEVSGLVDSAGQIKATRVERKALVFGGEVLEVNGIVAGLNTTDAATGSFFINALKVHYSVATSFDNGTAADLVDGALVEVKGNDDPSDGLDADRIEFKVEDFGNDGDLLQFEGVVNSIAPSVGDFEVNGLPVLTSGSTQWRGGYIGLGDVKVDDRVEVDGTLQDQSGTLVLAAREVEFENEDDVRFEGPVQAIDTSANILSILDVGVAYSDTNSITRFEDKDGENSSVDDLTSGDWVRIDATLDSSGNVFATRIEQDNNDERPDRIIIQGPAAGTPGLTPGDFTILGVTITRGPGVQYQVENSPISEALFFANLTDGRVVKARGSFSGGTLTANQLEMQN